MSKEVLKARLFPKGEAYLKSRQKRALDIIATITAAPLWIPPLVAGAIAIKLEDGGDIFFVHQRPGKGGEKFGMLKLRTMVPNAESLDKKLATSFPKLPHDHRVTRVGKLLRRWSVDEVPQVINILKGDMAFVGIRPPSEQQMRVLEELPTTRNLYPKWYESFCLTRPGATSLSSVKGRALLDLTEAGVRRRLRYDQFYIDHASLCFDLWIIRRGISALISGEGAW